MEITSRNFPRHVNLEHFDKWKEEPSILKHVVKRYADRIEGKPKEEDEGLAGPPPPYLKTEVPS